MWPNHARQPIQALCCKRSNDTQPNFQSVGWLSLFSLDIMRSHEAAGCDWASQPHLLDTAFVAGAVGQKAAWQ